MDYKLQLGTRVFIEIPYNVSNDDFGCISAIIADNVYDSSGKTILIKQGTQVLLNTVFDKRRAIGKPGQIQITGGSTASVDGKTIFLTGGYLTTGKDRQTLSLLLTILGFFCCSILSLFFLMIKGENAEIPAGSILNDFFIGNNYTISIPEPPLYSPGEQ